MDLFGEGERFKTDRTHRKGLEKLPSAAHVWGVDFQVRVSEQAICGMRIDSLAAFLQLGENCGKSVEMEASSLFPSTFAVACKHFFPISFVFFFLRFAY